MPLFRRKPEPEPEAPPPPKVLPVPAPAANQAGLRTLTDHRDWILSMVQPLMPFGMDLLDAIGLHLQESITADIALPGFDNSAMDGYAVRAADLADASLAAPVRLPVSGVVAAGEGPGPLETGTAMKIMTGAPIPEGADAVVPYEATDRGEDEVTFEGPVAAGEHVRRAGVDIEEGDLIAEAGTVLDARLAGVLAGIGVDKVFVRPRPRIVVIATGSELVEAGRRLGPGQLYDSNSYLVAAAAKTEGAQVWRVGFIGDDPDDVRQTISDQLIRADLIITTGGVSEGDFDVVKQVVGDLGPVDFARVAMQPGKPQGFGLIGDDEVPILMLPGNPVSAYVSFETFVRPVLRKLMGALPYVRPVSLATAVSPMTSRPGVTQLARARVAQTRDGLTVELVGGHGSHLLGDLRKTNALALLDEETEVVDTGDQVPVWLLDE